MDDLLAGRGPRLLAARIRRISILSPLQQDELRDVISEAALDLWLHDEAWPDLVDRCLDAVEEPDFPLT